MNIKISEEVKNAILNKLPVVALESTIISHGMPYPKNVETALLVEEEIRKTGAIPATIGIINGVPTVGLSKEEIEILGKSKGVVKVSRRDLPYVLVHKLNGATTVTTTMIFASMAGIKVFATGGCGGVHREANLNFDISADLVELKETNVTVVSAGIKAILDLPKTMEVLETYGVPVVGYKTKELPNFYTKHSGINLEYEVDSPLEIASMMKIKDDLNLHGGMLVANPILNDELDYDTLNKVIEDAIKESHELNIKGKEITPFLLKRICELTDGESLESNIKLVLNNAHLASLIAIEYSKL